MTTTDRATTGYVAELWDGADATLLDAAIDENLRALGAADGRWTEPPVTERPASNLQE